MKQELNYFDKALAEATITRDAVASLTEARDKIDKDAGKLRDEKTTLQADRETDPMELGRAVSALDHALDIVKGRRDAVTQEIDAKRVEHEKNLETLASAVARRADERLDAIRCHRRGNVIALARENGCSWAVDEVVPQNHPAWAGQNSVLLEMINLIIDPRLASLHHLKEEGNAHRNNMFPSRHNIPRAIELAERLAAELKKTERFIGAPAKPEAAAA